MASLSSVFGSTAGTRTSPAFHFPTGGHPTFVSQAPHKSSFIKNLVGDIHDAAVGLPVGLIETAKHPIRMTEASAKMTWQDWSPLFHGNTHEWAKNFHEHPLGPLLDVASVATLPFSGAGAALKGAEYAARAADATDVADRIAPIAAKFKTQSRVIRQIPGAPEGYVHYHGNPLIRSRQKAFEVIRNKVLKDSDFKRQARYLDRKISERGMATNAELFKQFRTAKALFKDKNITSLDIVNLLKPHIRHQMEQHAFTVDKATAAKLDSQNFEFLSAKETGREHFPADKTPQEMAKWLETQGANNTTGKMAEAARNSNGQYLVVRKDGIRNYLKEGRNSYGTLYSLWTKPTRVWKWLVLATAPRYFVNNSVGNMLMYSMSANPLATTRGLYHVIADQVGKRAALRGMTGAEKAMAKLNGNWQDKWYMGATGGFISEVTGVADGKSTKLTGARSAATRGVYGVTHKVSDELPRRMALNYLIKRRPEYQDIYRMYRQQGKGTLEAHALAADEASSIPFVRDAITNSVNDILGQYHHFSPLEDKVRNVVPFYSWLRAITRHSAHMAGERPLQADALANIGQMGVAKTEQDLGKIPEFMKGYISIGSHHGGLLGKLLGGAQVGRHKVITTQGLNPYSTLGDVADIAGAALSGHVPSGDTAAATALLPTVQAAIEHVTGQSLLTGARVKRHGGFLPDIAYRTYVNTPQGQIVQTALTGMKKPKVDKRTGKTHGPLLFHNDLASMLRSYSGIPVKDESPSAAHSQYDKEQGIKTGRKPKVSVPQFKLSKPKGTRRSSRYRVRRTVRRATTRGITLSSVHVKNVLPKVTF